MRLTQAELGGKLIPLMVPEEHHFYQRLLWNTYVRTWRAYPTAYQMHVNSGQFDTVVIDGKERNGIPATRHCVAQALRAEVLARMLRFGGTLTNELVLGVLLTDHWKFKEWRYMQEVGADWDSYAEAQVRSKADLEDSGMFGPRVLTIAWSVAHETLARMESLCDKFYNDAEGLTPFEIAELVSHYVDDISQSDAWVTEAKDGLNVLDARILIRNASNPTYMRLNEEGRTRLQQDASEAGYPGYFTNNETTYEAQARVGRRVQKVLTTLLIERFGTIFDALDLPVIVDNVIRRRFNRKIAQAAERWKIAELIYGGRGWSKMGVSSPIYGGVSWNAAWTAGPGATGGC